MEPLPSKFEINSVALKFGMFILFVVVSIPITLSFLSQRQDVRQRASTPEQITPFPTRHPDCSDKARSDINCDGSLDTSDFNTWRDDFLGNPQISQTASMKLEPSSGDHLVGQTFQVALKIDGGGTLFNAAQVSMSTTPNLKIENLTFGDCGFALVESPTNTNPSFAGVILGGSSTSCTVYTLTVKALSVGDGKITLSNAKVKSYGNATEILSTITSGEYEIHAATL